MYKLYKYILSVSLVFLPSFFLFGCKPLSSNPEQTHLGDVNTSIVQLQPSAVAAIHPGYGKADIRLVDFAVKTTGEVLANANMTTHINSPVTGRIIDVMASIGDHVIAGQKLLMIRSQDIEQSESDLLQNEAQVRADLKRDLLQIDSDLEQAQAQIRFSQSTYLRAKGLFEEKIASRAEFEAARTQYEKDGITVNTLTQKGRLPFLYRKSAWFYLLNPLNKN